jgi:xylulokinase
MPRRTMASYPTESRRPGYAEQNPDRWWDALRLAMSELLARPALRGASVEALGLTGQMHGAVFLDAAGSAVRPALMWSDGRAEAETAEIEKRIPATSWWPAPATAPTSASRRPRSCGSPATSREVMARTRWVVQPKDALRARLTGEVGGDVSDASATLLFDLRARTWSDDLCGPAGDRSSTAGAAHRIGGVGRRPARRRGPSARPAGRDRRRRRRRRCARRGARTRPGSRGRKPTEPS